MISCLLSYTTCHTNSLHDEHILCLVPCEARVNLPNVVHISNPVWANEEQSVHREYDGSDGLEAYRLPAVLIIVSLLPVFAKAGQHNPLPHVGVP